MPNNYLTKGYRYYVLVSANGLPVLGSMIVRHKPPRRASNGRWVDITTCVGGCCFPSGPGEITFTENPIQLTGNDLTGNIITESGATSPTSATISLVANFSQTIDGVIVEINSDGSYTISNPDDVTANFPIILQFQDTDGNIGYLTVNIDAPGA